MMSKDDKDTFKEARPYIVGLVALVFALRYNRYVPDSVDTDDDRLNERTFDAAELFVTEFERRNGVV